MSTAKDQQNKWLISITDGVKLGEIKDLFVDSGYTKVVASYLGEEGSFFKKTPRAIERSYIQVFGVDAWLVSGSDTTRSLLEISGSEDFILVSDIRGREIHSEGNTPLGVVEDVLLDKETNVVGFTLSKIFVQGPISERKAIAREAITNFGSKDTPMKTLLNKAESLEIHSTTIY